VRRTGKWMDSRGSSIKSTRAFKSYQQELILLRTSRGIRTDSGKQALYDLQRAEIPYVGDLEP